MTSWEKLNKTNPKIRNLNMTAWPHHRWLDRVMKDINMKQHFFNKLITAINGIIWFDLSSKNPKEPNKKNLIIIWNNIIIFLSHLYNLNDIRDLYISTRHSFICINLSINIFRFLRAFINTKIKVIDTLNLLYKTFAN